jgi:hypothetical protein
MKRDVTSCNLVGIYSFMFWRNILPPVSGWKSKPNMEEMVMIWEDGISVPGVRITVKEYNI